jgi:fumarate hydratase class II
LAQLRRSLGEESAQDGEEEAYFLLIEGDLVGLVGIEPQEAELDLNYVGESLMLVTALSPVIGYDRALTIAYKAQDQGTTLREAGLASRVSAEEFDRVVVPRGMVGDPEKGLEAK